MRIIAYKNIQTNVFIEKYPKVKSLLFFGKLFWDFQKWTKIFVQNRKVENTFWKFLQVLTCDDNALNTKKIIIFLLLNLKNQF